MDRKILFVAIIIVLTLCIITGCTTNNMRQDEIGEKQEENHTENDVKEKSKDFINIDKAKDIALNEVNNNEGIIVDYELEGNWNNYTHHEFEIQLDNEKHEIIIDAKTGNIIKVEVKENNHTIGEYNKYIGFDKAKKIALDNIKDKNYVITKFDLEDHNEEGKRTYYEVEFHSKNSEYEIKIDAESGKVISKDKRI